MRQCASGDITPGDDEKLHRFVASLPADTNLVGVALSSRGGNLLEGLRLATTVRNTRLSTGVAGQCASACFLVFAGGAGKLVLDGARIGVHSASYEGAENTLSQAVTTQMARKAAEFGVPAAIIGKMVTTPPDHMTWLTRDDLLSMSVRFERVAQPR